MSTEQERIEAKGAALEGAEDEALRDRMADLLTRTAAALKGPPKPLHLHDWADLPSAAATVVTERDEGRAAVKKLRAGCSRYASYVRAGERMSDADERDLAALLAETAGIVPEDEQ